MKTEALTPRQREEMERSEQLMEALQIREEIDLAADWRLHRLVFMPAAEIAKGMEIAPGTALRLRRAARARVIERWRDEEHAENG
jgi:hypothetical protein